MIDTSPCLEKLADALALAQSKMRPAAKTKENKHFKTKYADLDDCWAAAREPLAENGLAVFQAVSAEGKRVTIVTLLLHRSGQWIKSSLTVEAKDSLPQSIGSAITYGRRYGFCSAAGITSEEDDDGEAAQPSRIEKEDMAHMYPKQYQKIHVKPTPPPVPAAAPAVFAFDPSNEEHRDYLKSLFPVTEEEVDILAAELNGLPRSRAALDSAYKRMKEAIGG